MPGLFFSPRSLRENLSAVLHYVFKCMMSFMSSLTWKVRQINPFLCSQLPHWQFIARSQCTGLTEPLDSMLLWADPEFQSGLIFKIGDTFMSSLTWKVRLINPLLCSQLPHRQFIAMSQYTGLTEPLDTRFGIS